MWTHKIHVDTYTIHDTGKYCTVVLIYYTVVLILYPVLLLLYVVLGALGQRTTIREREGCGGVKGALGERTAHHLTYS